MEDDVNPGSENNTICMYTPSSDGGMAQYAWELMNALSDEGRGNFKVELVTGQDVVPLFQTDAYPIHAILPPLCHRNEFANRASWVASRLAHYPRREWRFLKWLRGRPDVVAVHLQEWTPWLAASMIRRIRAMGKQVFYTVHNIYPHRYPAMVPKAVMDRWVRKACRSCDGLFVHTERLAGQLAQFLGGTHPPIHVVPHGVWTVRGTAPRPTMEERLEWKKLLFFGTIRRNKGLDVLLRAAETLHDYSITIAGEPLEAEYYRTEILPQIQRLRNDGVKINLIDRYISESELPELLATHSAVVLPYTPNFVAQSGVIFLALAHELPVVASLAGGLKDLFEEFRVGVPFSEVTPAALAAAVRRLADPDVRRDVTEQIAAARSHYSWRETARATIAGYLSTEPETRQAFDDCAMATTSAQ